MRLSSRSLDPQDSELQRLRNLLPDSLQGKVLVDAALRPLPEAIRCGENPRGWMAIEIETSQWLKLTHDQRDLLFWHQVARIQTGTAPKERWERAALFLGLGGMIGELWVQDGILFGLCLGLASVSGYLLYRGQRKQGWPALVEADREAIRLAMQSGYTRTQAVTSLTSALQALRNQTRSAKQQALLEARLEALGGP